MTMRPVLAKLLLILGVVSCCARAESPTAVNTTMPPDAGPANPPVNSGSATRHQNQYIVPDIRVIRQDGQEVSFLGEVNDGRPVLLNFIFTSCNAICPLMTQSFVRVQGRLGDQARRVHMVSVSIDPESDTPDKLAGYAKKYQAGPQWSFYTGTLAASRDIQNAFGVWGRDKMTHPLVTLIRGAPGQPWIRLDGFANTDQIVGELQPFMGN